MLNIFLRCALLFVPAVVSASQLAVCKPYSFLQAGLDIKKSQNCQAEIKRCPSVNKLPDLNCAKQVMKNNQSCSQLKAVANTINANPNAVTAEKAGNYAIIEQFFAADGQQSYYIVSPAGCMVNTNIDLNTLHPHDSNTQLMTMNSGTPIYKKSATGAHFSTLLRVTKDCRACEVIGWAKINFEFDQKGKLTQVNLASMTKK